MAPDFTPLPHPDEQTEAVACWQAHVTAGRIGRLLPVDPQVVANRAVAEAIFLPAHRRTTQGIAQGTGR